MQSLKIVFKYLYFWLVLPSTFPVSISLAEEVRTASIKYLSNVCAPDKVVSSFSGEIRTNVG